MYNNYLHNTPEYWQAVNTGLISWEDAAKNEPAYLIRRERSLQTCHRFSMKWKEKHEKPDTGAYMPELSGRVCRDKNLNGQVLKAAMFLMEQIYMKARNSRTMRITVSYVANGIGMSNRTVQRYLRNLEAEGYIQINIVRHVVTGMVACLEVILLKPLFPRHHEKKWPERVEDQDTTFLSDKKSLLIYIRKESRTEWALKCMDGVWKSFMKTKPLIDIEPIPI